MDVQQGCLDLSNAAIALFDLVEVEGVDAPMANVENVMKLKAVIDASEALRGYYMHRNVQRMLALGVSPEALLRMTIHDK